MRALLEQFELVNADAETVLETVSDLFERGTVRLSLDPRTNSIVASGDQQALETIEAVTLRLDEAKGREIRELSSATFQVRLVWLVGGLEEEKATQPSDDLKPVLEELAKLGVGDVRQVGQVVVNTSPEEDFHVTCSPFHGRFASRMQIRGELELQEGVPLVDIDISGSQLVAVPVYEEEVAGAENERPKRHHVEHSAMADLSTRIAVPEGQYVVLGVTPAGEPTSVFVVQVTPQ